VLLTQQARLGEQPRLSNSGRPFDKDEACSPIRGRRHRSLESPELAFSLEQASGA